MSTDSDKEHTEDGSFAEVSIPKGWVPEGMDHSQYQRGLNKLYKAVLEQPEEE